MFCPKCGNAEQTPETYCRQCGTFLPDLSKPGKIAQTPQQHVTANIVLSSMTIVVSFTLAILLWALLGARQNTHPLIYATAGLLFAMGCWHIQTLWRTILLRKHLKISRRITDSKIEDIAATSDKILEQPDFENMVPESVTDKTTRQFAERPRRSS